MKSSTTVSPISFPVPVLPLYPHARTRRALLGAGAGLALSGCALRGGVPVTLPDTRQWELAAGGHRHRVMLAIPPGAPPPAGYPVLYVFDGDLLFALAAQLMRNRFARGAEVPVQGVAIVGLGYAGAQVLDRAARTLDYTPPAPGPTADAQGRPEGGADSFLAFIDARVRPLIERQLPIDPARRTLFGHSYGGLCVLHALCTGVGGFHNFVAASPSLWWRDGYIGREVADFVAARRADAAPLRLLLTLGEYEARAATTHGRDSESRMAALRQSLAAAPALQTHFITLPGVTHAGAMAPALPHALELAQAGWP